MNCLGRILLLSSTGILTEKKKNTIDRVRTQAAKWKCSAMAFEGEIIRKFISGSSAKKNVFWLWFKASVLLSRGFYFTLMNSHVKKKPLKNWRRSFLNCLRPWGLVYLSRIRINIIIIIVIITGVMRSYLRALTLTVSYNVSVSASCSNVFTLPNSHTLQLSFNTTKFMSDHCHVCVCVCGCEFVSSI